MSILDRLYGVTLDCILSRVKLLMNTINNSLLLVRITYVTYDNGVNTMLRSKVMLRAWNGLSMD